MHGPRVHIPYPKNIRSRNPARDNAHDHQHMWEIKSAAGKGLGVFANRFIPRGTRIFSERPLLAIQQNLQPSAIWAAFALLSPSARQDLLALSAHNTRESAFLRWNQAFWHLCRQNLSCLSTKLRGGQGSSSAFRPWSIGEHVTILHIFRSNTFHLGATETSDSSSSSPHQAVFPNISRINHSCIPNAQGNFHTKLGQLTIHAVRDINVDEELTLNYLPEHGALQATRQSKLLRDYGFTCACPACDLEGKRGRDGEEARVEMHNLLAEYAAGEQDVGTELGTILKFIGMLEGEGIAGRELSTLYLEAAKLNKRMGNLDGALVYADRGLKIDEDAVGKDHPLYQESLKVAKEIKSVS